MRNVLARIIVPRERMLREMILVLNGPNLNLLGTRQPEIYGTATLADVDTLCARTAADLGHELECRQSNREHDLIDWIQAARETARAIVVNAAAYTHTSIAILDALNMFDGPVIEVHISDIAAREPFRRHSYVSLRADHVVAGEGVEGYAMAIREAARRLSNGGGAA